MQKIANSKLKMQADCNATKIADSERFIADFLKAVNNDDSAFDSFTKYMEKVKQYEGIFTANNVDYGMPCTPTDILRMSMVSAINETLSNYMEEH